MRNEDAAAEERREVVEVDILFLDLDARASEEARHGSLRDEVELEAPGLEA
jgi:hypothetical protein